jgi:hypothetical protein
MEEPETARFEGEDTSPASQKELRGWYSIGLAAEIFAVCGVGRHILCLTHIKAVY